MNRLSRLTLIAALATLSTAAFADSFTGSSASSASSAGSASLGSLSDSLTGSSKSSTGNTKVADGDYRVVDVAELNDGRLQLRLRAADLTTTAAHHDADVLLALPKAALGQQGMDVGATVTARNRDYGLEFSRGQARKEPFFLVLHDAWFKELASQPVKL